MPCQVLLSIISAKFSMQIITKNHYSESICLQLVIQSINNFICISFRNHAINKKLCTYLKAKDSQEKLENDNGSFSNEDQHQQAIDALASDMEEIRNHLVDDNMVVRKGTQGITVKVFPQ